ncbi:hypothetical protein [Erwinia pyrifoliae]|uniref:Uncharacterized protein n=1 Tax=Erwinia pyrifoliae TaxID=79967 RepID=A0ABY5XBK7_ERWPY|nr:hypothetical protein [Erwinia pyrifoliae]MCA8876679.1 hypothetical protein [Erwinia pyrifoliae]MCT2386838.1 hypothetical protein [Erwinia pyrifoliae]MCU8587563.1 hypothetical protein [Erwinia pyrifoliae]UWS31409.1 hypothetical protein NYP81_08245 [Erwinia pyrifoliae]UWS34785.1 hypothetical protein NYP84_06395 [Erwinia pyrifoliae]
MSTTSKSVEVSRPSDANYNHEPEKTKEPGKTSQPVAFPPLPKESKVPAKSKGFSLPKFRFGLRKPNNQ